MVYEDRRPYGSDSSHVCTSGSSHSHSGPNNTVVPDTPLQMIPESGRQYHGRLATTFAAFRKNRQTVKLGSPLSMMTFRLSVCDHLLESVTGRCNL